MDDIVELLTKNNVHYRHSGKDYLVHCLNPEHDDSSPSMRIDRETGIFNCLSCGFKGNIFKYYGVFTNYSHLATIKLRNKLLELKTSLNGLKIPDGSVAYTKSFRGISAKTLREFEAFTNTKIPELVDRIVFPIRDIAGKIQVFSARHMFSDVGAKYVNYPRHTNLTLYPSKLPKGSDYVILVEGIFDLLNLWDNGIYNAVCTFGTNTLQSDTGNKLMAFKAQGISKIYIMFDGDDAGAKAAAKLKPAIEACQLSVEILELPNGKDPGSLDLSEINTVKDYIKCQIKE